MKIFSNKKIVSILTVMALASMVMLQVACEDNSLSAGDYDDPISITGVRYVSPDSTEDPAEIGPGDVIALKGNNLDAVASVYFNGYEATFNPNMATKDHLIVTVPSDMPFGDMDPDAYYMNTIKVENTASADSMEFSVQPPVPQVSDISNEYAGPGETITISGQYLYLVTGVTFPGDVAADLSTVTTASDGTWMEVQVPDGATTEGDIMVTSTAGTSPPTVRAEFLQTDGLVCNFDNVNTYVWGASISSDASTYPGANGNYALLTPDGSDVSSGDNSWWVPYRSINWSGGQWIDPSNLGEPVGNFAIKFEMAISGSWSTGTLLLRQENSAWVYRARYEPWLTAEGEIEPVEYDGWRTVTLPLTTFKTWGNGVDGGGTTVPNLQTLLPNGQAEEPGIMLYNDREGVLPADLEFAVDNIRVVRISE